MNWDEVNTINFMADSSLSPLSKDFEIANSEGASPTYIRAFIIDCPRTGMMP
jgi:hypothetical protein